MGNEITLRVEQLVAQPPPTLINIDRGPRDLLTVSSVSTVQPASARFIILDKTTQCGSKFKLHMVPKGET